MWKFAKNRNNYHNCSPPFLLWKKVDQNYCFENGGIVEEALSWWAPEKESGIYKYLWELQSKGDIA